METYPSASCGSLAAPRLWPLSPVAAEMCRTRWDARSSGDKWASCIMWGGTRIGNQDVENVTGDTDKDTQPMNQRSHLPSPGYPWALTPQTSSSLSLHLTLYSWLSLLL